MDKDTGRSVFSKEAIISVLQDSDYGVYFNDGMHRVGQIVDAKKFYETVIEYVPDRFNNCTTKGQVLRKANLGFAGASNLNSEDIGVKLADCKI
ncbi:hypothetical protein ACSOCI_12305 (plasmid) [Levilactobacillus brevis]|uniref:hypothetical protein n=1 Tax=Levilactobacillus brevis TaxID=1580 RepID=UPI003F623839